VSDETTEELASVFEGLHEFALVEELDEAVVVGND